MTGRVDHETVRRFWEVRSQETSNRWTPEAMFAWELGLLRDLAGTARSVLDLGCGHGELSRALAGEERQLTAVDFAPAYGPAFDRPNHRFIAAPVTAVDLPGRFDLVLLFGVVTSLDEEDEAPLYARVAEWLAPGGTFVVKNQCARGASFVVNGFSEALGQEYSGRYPNADEQQARLAEVFTTVKQFPYPPEFNPHDNSFHTAFICR